MASAPAAPVVVEEKKKEITLGDLIKQYINRYYPPPHGRYVGCYFSRDDRHVAIHMPRRHGKKTICARILGSSLFVDKDVTIVSRCQTNLTEVKNFMAENTKHYNIRHILMVDYEEVMKEDPKPTFITIFFKCEYAFPSNSNYILDFA